MVAAVILYSLRMARVAVFDKFHGINEVMDPITPALTEGGHEVVASAHDMRSSVREIIRLSQLPPSDQPELTILGGRLDGDWEYLGEPVEIATRQRTVRRRLRNLGRRRAELEEVTTTLLPIPLCDDDGRIRQVVFPTSRDSPISRNELPGHIRRLEMARMASGHASFVLSHITQRLLPGNRGIICVSSVDRLDLGQNPAISEYVDRTPGELEGATRALALAINRTLTREDNT